MVWNVQMKKICFLSKKENSLDDILRIIINFFIFKYEIDKEYQGPFFDLSSILLSTHKKEQQIENFY